MSQRAALPESSFVLATCQVGAEGALKAEVQRRLPGLRPAFMRPGFVTFKSDVPLPARFALELVFARALAISLGKCSGDDVMPRVLELARAHGPVRLHVWERARHAPGDAAAAEDDTPHAAADALASSLRSHSAAPALFLDESPPSTGDVVLDVVGVDPESWYVGMHVHGKTHSPFAGGDPRLTIPLEAPSRAWAKIEQGIRAADVRVQPGDRVVEVGASPGGVTHALLTRGCEVIAIDPGEMDARVLASTHLRHIRVPVAEVPPGSIARPVEWIVLDVNISPFAALRQVEALTQEHATDLCGLLLTLKLGDWHMAARVPHLVSLVKKLGAPVVEARAFQLPANKVEIWVAALTARGVARRRALG